MSKPASTEDWKHHCCDHSVKLLLRDINERNNEESMTEESEERKSWIQNEICRSGASFIKCCAETILKLIL